MLLSEYEKDLRGIFAHYGSNNQRVKLIEEFEEVLEAIRKHMYSPDQNSLFDVASEIADVYVMLAQFANFYGIKEDDIKGIAKIKILRQKYRIKFEESEK